MFMDLESHKVGTFQTLKNYIERTKSCVDFGLTLGM